MQEGMKRITVLLCREVMYEQELVVEVPESVDDDAAAEWALDATDWYDVDDCGDDLSSRPLGRSDAVSADLAFTANGEEVKPPPPTIGAPTDDCWMTLGDHRWATNGHIAIREDYQILDPDTPQFKTYATWRTGIEADVLQRLIDDCLEFHVADESALRSKGLVAFSADSDLAWVAPCDAPLLRGDGIEVRVGGNLRPVLAMRDGEPVAVVMPRRTD